MDDFSDLPSWQRYLILMGSGMMSSIHGAKQLANGAGLRSKLLGTTDADLKDQAFADKATQRLSDATPGGFLAEMAGNLADPVSVAAGGVLGSGAKALKAGVGTLARREALKGALTGGLAEEKDGGSRLENMAFGAGMGAAGPSVTAGKSAVSKIWAGKKANLTPEEVANATKGYTVPFSAENAPQSDFRTWVNEKNTKFKDDILDKIDAGVAASHAKEPDKSARTVGMAGALLDAPDMFRAYPELAHTPVVIRTHPENGNGGEFLPDVGAISIDASGRLGDKNLSTLIHELQHKVQSIEGNPQGDSAGRLQSMLGDHPGFQAYLANPGEIEARDAAARAALDRAGTYTGNMPYGELHAAGPNTSAFTSLENAAKYDMEQSGRPAATLPKDNAGILRDQDPSGILSAAMTNPRMFHLLPMDTRALNPDVMQNVFADGVVKGGDGNAFQNFLRSLRFTQDGDTPFVY